MPAGRDAGADARNTLLHWIETLLERGESSWREPQRDFLESLLMGQEGAKTLAELAVTSARIKASGLKPEDLGALREIHEAIEVFWNNPCPETYENLRTVGRSLETDT